MRTAAARSRLAGDLDARRRARSTGSQPATGVDVAIRPENIRLGAACRRRRPELAKITNHVFLGNISEYYATLRSGQVLRVQTHPLQQFRIGDEVAIEVDATQCSVFRRAMGDAT